MGCDGLLAAVSIIVEQLLALLDVPRRHQDEVWHAVDVVQFGLAVPRLAVVEQPSHPPCLLSGVHTEEKDIQRNFNDMVIIHKIINQNSG